MQKRGKKDWLVSVSPSWIILARFHNLVYSLGWSIHLKQRARRPRITLWLMNGIEPFVCVWLQVTSLAGILKAQFKWSRSKLFIFFTHYCRVILNVTALFLCQPFVLVLDVTISQPKGKNILNARTVSQVYIFLFKGWCAVLRCRVGVTKITWNSILILIYSKCSKTEKCWYCQ